MKHQSSVYLNIGFLFLLLPLDHLFAGEFASKKDEISYSGCMVSWLEDRNEFRSGDIATIKIKALNNFGNEVNLLSDGAAVRFTLLVNGTKGNSSYVSGVSLAYEERSSYWNITFIPILVGVFSVNISDEHVGISNSSLYFSVKAGPMYPSTCVAFWKEMARELFAGSKVNIFVLPKDAFGNNISREGEGSSSYNFTVSAFHRNGSATNVLNVRTTGWTKLGYIGIEFVVFTAGNLSLYVAYENQTLYGSPLPLCIKPGLLDMAKCFATWKYETNALQIFSTLEVYIHQKDTFGNPVLDLYAFDACVVNKATNLSVPVEDLSFKEVGQGKGIQLLSFTVYEPGYFMLTIFDGKQNGSMPELSYNYTVFVGYCHGLKSVVNGSGLAGSVAGYMSFFSVYLEDMYNNPSPVETEKLRVQILRQNDSYGVKPKICPLLTIDGPLAKLDHGAGGPVVNSPELPVDVNDTCGGHQIVETSTFNVSYMPEKSGSYEVWVFCGNIPLNDEHPYTKEVFPGKVNASLSHVAVVISKVKRQVWNEVRVQLVDSFLNPVPSQESKLNLDMSSINNDAIIGRPFKDSKNGSYIGYFRAKHLGRYEICVSFEDKHLAPCPFEISVYKSDYFPQAYNDTFSVWEDESVAFDVLENDYFSGDVAEIVESSFPQHGTLLRYGQLFRYTPFKGFSGNDSFTYTVSDKYHNTATGAAIISVMSSPPRFVSLPIKLQVIEDVMTPRFGGFPGFQIKYSNLLENISVTLSTQSGTIFLSSVLMQVWQPLEFSGLGTGLVVKKEERAEKELILVGHVEVINYALQLIQYLGNDDFYGSDIITLTAKNKNGIRDAHVPLLVEPINDPPYIRAPGRIILEKKRTGDGFRIFDKAKDTFDFSIGDPDTLHFMDATYEFTVALSLEISDGILIANLHSDVISTIEVKPEYGYQWQPLQSVVIIANHSVIRGKGVRFVGTIKDCNDAMAQLFYRLIAIQTRYESASVTLYIDQLGCIWQNGGTKLQWHFPTQIAIDIKTGQTCANIHCNLEERERRLHPNEGGIKGYKMNATFIVCEANNGLGFPVQGAANSVILTIRVNDMGNYGCHSGCTQNMSLPLLTEATVNLIKRMPMGPFLANCLGSAIIIGFITTLFLGMVLLFFTCKCAIALRNKRRNHYDNSKIELARAENFDKPALSRTSSENVTYFTGYSNPLLLRSQPVNFRQRSRRASRGEESSKEEFVSASQNYQQSSFGGFISQDIQSGPA